VPLPEIAVYLIAAVVFAAAGAGIGMLVARWLSRLTDDPDEEPGDDQRSDA
jgi:cation transporter-like permease